MDAAGVRVVLVAARGGVVGTAGAGAIGTGRGATAGSAGDGAGVTAGGGASSLESDTTCAAPGAALLSFFSTLWSNDVTLSRWQRHIEL